MRTRNPTWRTKAESLEVNAKVNIEIKLTPSIKNTIFRVFHVGALTPGARAPTRTACAEDTSSSPDLLSSIFNPVSRGSLGCCSGEKKFVDLRAEVQQLLRLEREKAKGSGEEKPEIPPPGGNRCTRTGGLGFGSAERFS